MLLSAVNKFNKLPRSKKIQLITAVLLTVLLLGSLPVMAWFTGQKKLAAMAKVDSPSVIVLSAGHNEGIVNLELSDIDVTLKDDDNNRITSKKYVFCVAGSDTNEYMLQLAYTTNNQFEYFIYPATESETLSADAVAYLSSEESDDAGNRKTYYYKQNTALSGNYIVNSTIAADEPLSKAGSLYGRFLNSTDGLNAIKDDTYRAKAYDSYTKIQDHAYPIYWQTVNSINSMESDSNDGYEDRRSNKEFLNYYILEVSWARALANDPNLTNSKETDMIYITAKAR